MKKALKILFNIFLCIVHGLCVLYIQTVLSSTLIWYYDTEFSEYVWTLAGVALYLALHYLVLGQLFKRSLLCKYTLPALRWIEYVPCISVSLLWIGIFLYLGSLNLLDLCRVFFVVGVNAAIVLARKYFPPTASEGFAYKRRGMDIMSKDVDQRRELHKKFEKFTNLK